MKRFRIPFAALAACLAASAAWAAPGTVLRNDKLYTQPNAATTKSDPSRVVAVAGLRGLNDEELKAAKFNPEEMARLDAQGVSGAQARGFASQGGLAAVSVPALPKPEPQSSSSSWGSN